MKKFIALFFVLVASFMFLSAPVAQASVVYSADFEDNDGGFTHSGTNDSWQWGTPISWPESAGEGTKCWGTNLSGNYADNSNFTLNSPTIDLTEVPGGTSLVLKWKQAWEIESSTWDNASMAVMSQTRSDQTAWSHSNSTITQPWTELSADISGFAGDRVQLEWTLSTDGSVTRSGIYVDDVRIEIPGPVTYTVTASADVHGTVSPDVASVDSGEDLTVFFSPDEGYQLNYLTVEISGYSTHVFPGSPDRYILENVSDDVSLTAYFAFDEEMLADAGLDDMHIDDLRFALSLPGSPDLPEGISSDDYEVFDFDGVGSPSFSALTSGDVTEVPELREIFLQGLSFDLAAGTPATAELPVLVTDMFLVVSHDVLGEALCASIDEGSESAAFEPNANRENIADDFFRYVRLYKVLDGVPYDLYALEKERLPDGEVTTASVEPQYLYVYSGESAYYVRFTLALIDHDAGDVAPVQALSDDRGAFFLVFDGEADGHFRDPLVLTTLPEENHWTGSGGNCNVGFSPAVALLFLPLLGLLKKR